MKRMLSCLLAAALLLCLAGCRGTTEDPSFTMPPVTPGESHTGHAGLEIQVDGLEWNEQDGTVLVVTWNNGTDSDVTYGSAYAVERLDGEEWVSSAKGGEPIFDAIGYELKAGQTRKESYDLTDTYDVSVPGTYRFRTDCYVMDGDDKGVRCELTAEFTVAEGSRPADSAETGAQVQFCARYFRIAPEEDGLEAPAIWIIGSLQDLRDHHNIYHERFGLEVMAYSTGDRSSSHICDGYDAEFFEENFLVILYMGQGSSSVRHEVRSVERTDSGKLAVAVDREVPEICTADLTRWHILLELRRDAMVEAPGDISLILNGKTLSGSGTALHPQRDILFREPPAGTLITPEGETALRIGGYSWFCRLDSGLMEATTADQAYRPLNAEGMKPAVISSEYAETVYAPVPGSPVYKPTNALGYLVKLAWEAAPASVTYTCWPDTVWKNSDIPEEDVVAHEDHAFYAKPGSYVYEITATWEDIGTGYHGTANYYVYIIAGNNET